MMMSQKSETAVLDRQQEDKMKKHKICEIVPGSIMASYDVEPGDFLVKVNNENISDIFDYQYACEDTDISVTIEKNDGTESVFNIVKDEDDDLGLIFENGFMDDYRSCSNKCIFCFIDQNPPGMRPTIYFKDDDSRLSFLQGNYVTLTNMSDDDIDRIIKYNLSPINISFQTTNPKLRCKMLTNRFAGDALKKVDKLFEAGITMNGQIVLCKGVNDGDELERTIADLTKYLPYLESVSVVPVGLTKYRDGLYPLEPFTKEDAIHVLETVNKWQKKVYEEYNLHFIHASDEFYILAGYDMPPASDYDGYLQIENGVGMIRSFTDEFDDAISDMRIKKLYFKRHTVSLVTGLLAYPTINNAASKLMDLIPKLTINVYPITNNFFGEKITVSGLLTGTDIIEQLKDKELGEKLFLPENLLRAGEDVLLDDVKLGDIERTLQVKTDIVKSSGWDFVHRICGDYLNE